MLERNLLYQLTKVKPEALSREENYILEGNLFSFIYQKLMIVLNSQYKEYAQLLRASIGMDEICMEKNLAQCLINDILTSELYTLDGIAFYTNSPEDVIFDIAVGKNNDPTGSLLKKIIELHRSVRPTLYSEIMKKFIQETLN